MTDKKLPLKEMRKMVKTAMLEHSYQKKFLNEAADVRYDDLLTEDMLSTFADEIFNMLLEKEVEE